MKVRDAFVILANVLHCVAVCRGEVADVQVHAKLLRQCERLSETLRPRQLVRIVGVRMAVYRQQNSVTLDERGQPRRHAQRR